MYLYFSKKHNTATLAPTPTTNHLFWARTAISAQLATSPGHFPSFGRGVEHCKSNWNKKKNPGFTAYGLLYIYIYISHYILYATMLCLSLMSLT